ncbi:MAG: PorV/PorQ family protein [Bacteroidota bacterium]|jgi:hypothetical protein
MFKKLLTLIYACFISHLCVSQTVKYSNEFLNIGVGARSLGMGYTGVASVQDVTSGYWNPAGLVGMKDNLEAGLMHAEYFAGIAKYDYGALSFKLDSLSSACASFVRFGIDNIPNTVDLIDANGNVDYDRISTFSATDFALILSYGRKIKKINGLDIGANTKIIRRRIGDFAGSWGFGLDAAVKYSYKDFRFAAVARDITGTFNAWSYNLSPGMISTFQATGNEIPVNNIEVTVPRLILGGSWTKNFYRNKMQFTGEINLISTFDGKRNVFIQSNILSTDPVFGVELGYLNTVFLRGGVNNIQRVTEIGGNRITTIQPNFGVGLKYKIFFLDYALADFSKSTVSTVSHIFSLKIEINKKIKSRQQN